VPTATAQPTLALAPVQLDFAFLRKTFVEANVKDADEFHRLFDHRSFALTTTAVTATQVVTLVLSTHMLDELSKSGISAPSADDIVNALGIDWLKALSTQRPTPKQVLIVIGKELAYIGGEFDFRTGPASVIKVISLQRVGDKQYYRGNANTSGLGSIMWSDEVFERLGDGVVGVNTDSPWNVITYFRRDKNWHKMLIPLEINQERRALQRHLETWDQLTEEQRYTTLFGNADSNLRGVLDRIVYVNFTDAQKTALRKSFELLTKIDGTPNYPDTYDNGLGIEHPFTLTNMVPLLTYARKLIMEPGLKGYWLDPSGKSGRIGVAYGVARSADAAVGLNPVISSNLQMLMIFKEAATNLATINFGGFDLVSAFDSNDLGPASMHGAFLDHYPAIYSWLLGKEIESAGVHAMDSYEILGQRGFFMEAAAFQGK
jgi:hypothetical protein